MSSCDSQNPDCIFDPPCESGKGFTLEVDRRPNLDLDRSRMRPLRVAWEHAIDSSQPNWNDRKMQAGSNHSNAGGKVADFACGSAFAFGKNQIDQRLQKYRRDFHGRGIHRHILRYRHQFHHWQQLLLYTVFKCGWKRDPVRGWQRSDDRKRPVPCR